MSLSSFLVSPFRYQNAALRSPQSLLFPRLNSLNSLSLSSQQRGSSPRIIFVASSGPTPTAPGLSCAQGSRAGHGTPGWVYVLYREGRSRKDWNTVPNGSSLKLEIRRRSQLNSYSQKRGMLPASLQTHAN